MSLFLKFSIISKKELKMQRLFKNYITIFLLSLLMLVSAYFIFIKITAKKLPEGLIASSGRIDGDLILLNSKYPARIEDIFVQESDKVKKNQIIAKLNSQEFLSKYKSLNETINSAKNEKLAYKHNIKAMKIELQLLQKTLPKSIKIKQNSINRLKKNLQVVEVQIATIKLNLEQKKRDYQRYKKLYKAEKISKEKFELIELQYKTTQKEYQSLQIKKDELKTSINTANILLQIEKENLKKIDILKQKLKASQIKLKSIEDKIQSLIANRDEVKAMINELTLKSPVDGFVIEKIANKGEVINASMPVVTLSDPNSYYLKIFVDTISNGKIKVGDNAEIFLDSYPNKAIKAKVTLIAQKAEFTPKDVSVRSDRIQRVYAVHLKPIEYNPLLKLGIPAIGIISIDNSKLPKSLNEIPEI